MKNVNKNRNNYLSVKTNLPREKSDHKISPLINFVEKINKCKNPSISSSCNSTKDWLELECDDIEFEEGGRI